MPDRNPALPIPTSVRTLEACIDRYARLISIERSGRLYEWTGVRLLYLLTAHLFGEASLPPSRNAAAAMPGLSRHEIEERRDRTLYYEISNLVIFLFYLPLVAMTAMLHSALVFYALLLCLLHGSLVLIERYKRALLSLHLSQSPISQSSIEVSEEMRTVVVGKPVGQMNQPAASQSRSLSTWYFLPHRFETDRLYRALGMETVRQWVILFARLTAAPKQRQGPIRSLPGASIAHLLEFDHETRVSEASHLVGILLELPFLALFALRQALPGIAYIATLLLLNTSFVLLQRATRLRLWRVLSKRGVPRQ
jgi:hypothetical protein